MGNDETSYSSMGNDEMHRVVARIVIWDREKGREKEVCESESDYLCLESCSRYEISKIILPSY